MTTLQQQARALGDPTRHAIFRRIADAPAPVSVAEINEGFALNHNAVRQHLAKLVAAGLVIEATAKSSGPGRPRLVYVVDPAVEGQWGTAGPYERLSRLLVEIISSGDRPEVVGRRAADLFRVATPSGDAVADIAAAMARQGFEPELVPSAGGTDMILRNCPFASTAKVDRRTVCALHLGIADGLAEGSEVVVDQLVARAPAQAGCVLRIRIPADGHPPGDDDDRLRLRGRVS
jgi:predicted ArsR family transcriptional regulator